MNLVEWISLMAIRPSAAIPLSLPSVLQEAHAKLLISLWQSTIILEPVQPKQRQWGATFGMPSVLYDLLATMLVPRDL